MTIDVIGVMPDPKQPNQFFEIVIGAQSELPNPCWAVIERPGQEQAYLGPSGWQSIYTKLEIVVRYDGMQSQGLRFSQNILQFFEIGYNYKIVLVDMIGKDIDFFVIGWNPSPEFLRSISPVSQQVAIEETQQQEPLPIEPVVSPPPEPLAVLPPLEPVAVLPQPFIGSRELIKCMKCGGAIFSTLPSCPYCESALRS